MIKLGTMSLNVRNTTATEFAGIVSDLGLDVIELHSSAFESTDLDYLRDLKMDLMKKGLPIGYIGISNNFGRPVEEHPEQISLIKKWIDVASFMSCPIVRVFAAYLPEDCTDEEAIWPPMISGFKEVAEYGYEKGILVGLQNHNHNNVTRTGNDLIRALRETDHPYFTHILDTGQYAGSPGASGHRGTSHPIMIVTIVLLRLRRMLYIFELNFTRLIAVSKSGWIILASSISCEHRTIMVVFQLFTKGNQIL